MTTTDSGGGGGVPDTPENITVTDDATMKRAVGAAAVGNITEWFDFGVYAYLATTIEENFFPPDNPTLAQVGVFAGAPELPSLIASLARGEPGYPNTLEAGVVGLEPVVGEVLDALRGAGLKGVRMSGSGATCFGVAGGGHEAEVLAATLAEAYPAWWTAASTNL